MNKSVIECPILSYFVVFWRILAILGFIAIGIEVLKYRNELRWADRAQLIDGLLELRVGQGAVVVLVNPPEQLHKARTYLDLARQKHQPRWISIILARDQAWKIPPHHPLRHRLLGSLRFPQVQETTLPTSPHTTRPKWLSKHTRQALSIIPLPI